MLKLIFVLLIITSSAYAERAATIIETTGEVYIKRENGKSIRVLNTLVQKSI